MLAAIDLCAFFIALECSSRSVYVAVYFPRADIFVVGSFILDKVTHVLRRISKEKPDFMRKNSAAAEALDQPGERPAGRSVRITALRENPRGFAVFEVSVRSEGR